MRAASWGLKFWSGLWGDGGRFLPAGFLVGGCAFNNMGCVSSVNVFLVTNSLHDQACGNCRPGKNVTGFDSC
jgi:hypothetical protein